MNKIIILIFIPLFLLNCSFNENSKIWNKEKKIVSERKKIKKVLLEEKKIQQEFNSNLKIDLTQININKVNYNQNNFGSLKYSGLLEKVENFNFGKLKNVDSLDFSPLFLQSGFIFFSPKGSIFRYDDNKKIIWKKNYYSKSEKKLNPKLIFSKIENNVLIADNLGKFYLINLENGDLIWMKNNIYPFNSDIKIKDNNFFIVDYKNTLRCFSIKSGSELWNFQTEDSFTLSSAKNSIVISNEMVIFSNSIGDITAIDALDGSIQWQLPTQSNSMVNENYNFKNSKLVLSGKSIYFSNNRNQFFSVDVETGKPNWKNEVSSSIKPIVIEDYIFTVSDDGYLYTLLKDEGDIIRINDVFKNYKPKDRKKIKTIGFSMGNENLYITNNDGKIIVINLSLGNIINIKNISRNLISEPFIFDNHLYIINNRSIFKYN